MEVCSQLTEFLYYCLFFFLISIIVFGMVRNNTVLKPKVFLLEVNKRSLLHAISLFNSHCLSETTILFL